MNNQPQDPTPQRTAKSAQHGAVFSILATLLWVATTLQAVASTAIVTAGYISAWIMRAQHRVLVFFTEYAGAVMKDQPPNVEAAEEPTDEEIEASQRGDGEIDDGEIVVERRTSPRTAPHPGSEYQNIFGGKSPKGQA